MITKTKRHDSSSKMQVPAKCVTLPQMNLIFNSRIFWRELANWTRVYFISNFKAYGNMQSVFSYLFSLPNEFTAMLRLVFGGELAEGYCDLLEKHIYLVRDLAAAQLNSDTDTIGMVSAQLYENANERATYLANINPFWSESAWRNYMNLYTKYTIEEADTFAAKNYEMNMEGYERLASLTNDMGYYFSQGMFNYMTYQPPAGQNPGMIKTTRTRGPHHKNRYQDQCFTFEQLNTIFNIKMFWYEFSIWLRAYMESRYIGLDAEEKVMARLKKVPIDYTNQLKRFFGEKITNQYLTQLNAHIDLVNELITAQMGSDSEKVEEISQLLYQNADQRAAYLSSVNPFLDVNEMKRMLYGYVRTTIEESNTYLSQDPIRNTVILDRLIDHTSEIGEYFSRNLFNYLSFLPGE